MQTKMFVYVVLGQYCSKEKREWILKINTSVRIVQSLVYCLLVKEPAEVGTDWHVTDYTVSQAFTAMIFKQVMG